MLASPPRRLAPTAAAVLIGALMSGCAGSATSPVAPAAPTTQQSMATSFAQQPPAAPKALYVSDNVGKSVFRFVINGNGMLQTPAGSSLVLGFNPGSIAIAQGGKELFVANLVNNAINVYKAGVTAYTPPKRTLILNFQPSGVAVDTNGNLFVGGSTTGYVAVFAPKAKNHAKPIQVISLPDKHFTVNGVAVDSAGSLYMSDTNEVSVFTTPTTNPTLSRAIIGNGQQAVPSGMAIDSSGENYVTNTGANDVLAYSPTANGTSAADRVISANGSSPLRAPVADAVNGTNLYVTSGNAVFGPASIFVLNSQIGAQTPIQIVTGSYLAVPVGVALGP
jgi:sugar lactone lactonase YvrE